MAKRFYPQQQGNSKRAKLDISISDHNFPLSQNNDINKDEDTWGDDNDDEILLLASQACEQAYSTNNVSLLPDYSICMEPGSTSTQLHSSLGPSTSKTEFTFKKPSTNPPSSISTHLREKCSRIASPLPGITAKALPNSNEPVSVSDDLIFNDKIYKGQDSDHIYRQLLQLQEENAKLKSENGKLLEKCVTKEGEASILRTQLKTSHVAVDNARLEKIKAQERVQMEWTEKLTAANSQMCDLRNQLDFKNLEIISIKEKCKKLESTKVRMTQVTVGHNDISSSHRQGSSFVQNEFMTQSKKVKTLSNAVQTDKKACFMTLNKTVTKPTSPLNRLLPHILEPTTTPHSLLDYNEKLTTDQPHCKVFSTFHRIISNSVVKREKCNLTLASVYEDLVKISNGNGGREAYFNVFNVSKSILTDVTNRLETIGQRMTTAFQKEMDEKYIEATSSFLDVSREDLLKGRILYKEEQEILARRMTGILSYIVDTSTGADMFRHYEQCSQQKGHFIECIEKICSLLDNTSTATLYSGLLLAITHTLPPLTISPNHKLKLIKTIITSRPMPFVSCEVLKLVTKGALWKGFRKETCPGTSVGNLKTDYDQGVLMYKKDSCYLQILLKQIEACLKCIDNQQLTDRAVKTTRHLITLYSNMNCDTASLMQDQSRCDCQLVLVQVIVYALRICAVMLDNIKNGLNEIPPNTRLLPVCRSGIHLLYQCSLKDVELSSRLSHNEGHLVQLTEIMRANEHTEVYANMLSELAGALQASPEEMPPSFHKQPWLKSFQSFSMAD